MPTCRLSNKLHTLQQEESQEYETYRIVKLRLSLVTSQREDKRMLYLKIIFRCVVQNAIRTGIRKNRPF